MQTFRRCAGTLGLLTVWVMAAGVAWAGDGDLRVRRMSPSGTDVTPAQEAVIQFDRKMVALGDMAREGADLPVRIRPDPGCQWRWLNTSELACRLPEQQTFVPATTYTIHVGTGLEALDGSHLAKPVSTTFTTSRPKVDWTTFREWRSPVMPVFKVRLNLPVTARELAAHVGFQAKDGTWVAASVEPYTKKRQGPVWLPVPGVPGAVVKVDDPEPDTPLDAGAEAAQGRRVWQVVPAASLQGASAYEVRVKPGLRSPLGPLAGEQSEAVDNLETWGDFTFRGVQCEADSHTFEVHAGQSAHRRCDPNSLALQFSSPVPRETLAALRWEPVPEPSGGMRRMWRDYPQWFLGLRQSAHAPARPDRYPLTFRLDPMRDYTVHVPAGVKDRFGRTLAEPARVTFRTGHRVPFFDAPPSRAVLEADQPTIVPLRFTNLDQLTFRHHTLFAADLPGGKAPSPRRAALFPVPFVDPAADAVPARERRDVPLLLRQSLRDAMADRVDARRFDTPDLLSRSDLEAPTDRIVRGRLGIREMLRGRAGAVWGELNWGPRGPWQPMGFMGQVTPWQVLAKVGHYDTLVWVGHLDDARPVSGAHVGWLHGHGQELDALARVDAGAVTDADGLAVLSGTADLPDAWFHQYEDKSDFYIGAAQDQDMVLLPLEYRFERSLGEASHHDFWSDTKPPAGHLRAWAVTEQGIYRPGSDVSWAAFVRAEGATALQAAPKRAYTASITDPQGNEVFKRVYDHLPAYGEIHDTLHVSANAPMGRYDIRVAWKTTRGTETRLAGQFTVTDFVPAAFKVRAALAATRLGPGQKAAADVHATLHAGGPYTGAEVKFTTRLVPRRFHADNPAASGFTFGDGSKDLPDARTLAESRATLDHDGRARASVTLPAKGDVVYGEVTTETAVKSARGTWVADTARVPFVARDRFLGLRTGDWMQTAGKAFQAEYVVVDAAGKPQPGSDVELVLQRRTLERVKVKDGAGEFGDEEQVRWIAVDRCRATSSAAPGHCRLTPDQAGRYRVRGTVTDTRGRRQTSALSTWVTGAGHVTWSRSGKGVTLVPDKNTYHPGEVAHVLVQNPYPGARALVTVERYGVLWKKVVTLKGSAPVIDVPVAERFFPGAYLSVAIFSPRAAAPADPDLGRPELALGYMALKVAGKGSSLDVRVTPARDQYKPRQEVRVDVAVGAGGKAAGKTRLVAAVVDQGVVDLLREGTDYYDPRKVFYAPPDGPDIANYSLAEQLLTRLAPKRGKGENPGGGGGGASGPNVRSDFRYATYWNATLETDASGHARFRFKLPDNLTRWRILVMALGPDDTMGLGDASVRVNLPLQIEPALPNQMRVGDRFGAAFQVTNRTDATLDAVTRLAASGAIESGETRKDGDRLHLASFGHGLSWLPLTATGPGRITLDAEVASGQLSDAVQARIPVRPAGTEVVAAEYGSTTGAGASVPVKMPADAVPDRSRVQVTLAPTLVGGLDGAFRFLRDDPLRTWEVRLSRAVLASDYLRLKPVLGQALSWDDAQAAVDDMLKASAAFQAPSGGMAFWIPRDEFVSKYLSVYTALAFDWLDEAGHAPPSRPRAKLLDYLREHVLKADDDKPEARVLRAATLAALALSRDGKVPDGAVAGMLDDVRHMRLFGQAMLLQAAVAQGQRESADRVLEALFTHAEESGGSISFNEREAGLYADLLATPLRSNCAILDAMARYKRAWGDENLLGDTPQKLMRWVTARRRNAGGWPNSQENVFCTTAITHYADAYEPPVENLSGQLELPDGKPRAARFASRADAAVRLDGAAAKPGEAFDVKLQRGGKGRLYYSVQAHYTMPPDALPAADAGMTLSRHYAVQRDGEWQPVADDSQLKRGDIVRVTLDVDVPTERHHVVLTDPLPGAFEAVNRLLATSPGSTPAAQPGVSVLMFDGGAWPNMSVVTGGFYHRETGFDAVRFFADDLPAGRYQVVYSAQVIAPGRFVAPAPKVEEIYQPDVFGRGVSQHLNVAMPES